MLTALSNNDINQMNETNKLISSEIKQFSSVELANGIFTIFNPIDCFMKIVEEYDAKLDKLKDAEQKNKWEMCKVRWKDTLSKIKKN